MNIHHLLFFCWVPGCLCYSVFTKQEGESLSFGCSFSPPPGRRFFSKTKGSSEILLVETSDLQAQSGKYSISYEEDIFSVTISQLRRSDSGHYRCGVGNASSPELEWKFQLRVTNVMCEESPAPAPAPAPGITVCSQAEGGTVQVACSLPLAEFFNLFFCKGECKKEDVVIDTSRSRAQRGRFRIDYQKNGLFHVTVTNLTASDSGLYRCGVNVVASSNPCKAVDIRVVAVPTPTLAGTQPSLDGQIRPSAGVQSCTASSASPPTTRKSAVAEPSALVTPAGHSEPLQDEDEGNAAVKGPSALLLACLTVLALLLALLPVLLYLMRKSRNGLNMAASSRCENMELESH